MARYNIFQILSEKADFTEDVERIDDLFSNQKLIVFHSQPYTLTEFVDRFCFDNWKSRGHCLDVDDFLEVVDYYSLENNASANVDDFITFSEVILNFYTLVYRKMDERREIKCYANFSFLHDIIIEDLSKINHTTVYDTEKEQLLVVEDKSEITTVAETINQELAFDVIKYNHHSLAGNIEAKKSILLKLGAELESKRKKELTCINKQLVNDIFFLLNKLNIRHNNCAPGDSSKFVKCVYEMEISELEHWYDELYQMILLAFLELNQVDRNNRIYALKKLIEEN